MKTFLPFCILALVLSTPRSDASVDSTAGSSQNEYEKSIEAVVRNKEYYKAGKIEVGLDAGAMPYDSLVNHYMVGGKFTWHLTDHFGWEVFDGQVAFPATTGFTTDLVAAKGLSKLDTVQIRFMGSTNLLVSPIYGKIRFFGTSVLHFDIYLALGGGIAKTETNRFSSAGIGQQAVGSIVKSGMDPMVDFGVGFKFYLNHAMGLLFDIRDYMTYSTTYDQKSMKSNFSVFGGLTFFLPTFGRS